jgi:hypothetical protein
MMSPDKTVSTDKKTLLAAAMVASLGERGARLVFGD